MKTTVRVVALGACLAMLLPVLAAWGHSATTTLTIAIVNNSQMVQMEQLTMHNGTWFKG